MFSIPKNIIVRLFAFKGSIHLLKFSLSQIVWLFAFKGSAYLLKFGLSQIYKNCLHNGQKFTKQTYQILHTNHNYAYRLVIITNIPNTYHSCVDRLVIKTNISKINHLSQLCWSSSNNKLTLFLFCVSVWEGRECSGPLSANARRVRQDGDEEERRRSSAGQIMLPYLIQNLV